MSAQEENVPEAEVLEDLLPELDMLEQTEEKSANKSQDPLKSLYKHHPESMLDYQEAVIQKLSLQSIPPDSKESPDANHKSQPFLTQYEKTRILGFRTNQLAQGAIPYVAVPAHIRNVSDIAKMELEQRRLPFIIKRPMPDGTFEYWRLSDLMIL
jgi:DNA-directed RNA polymerase subunit K/omega